MAGLWRELFLAAFSLCLHREVSGVSSYKDTSPIRLGSICMTSFSLKYFPKGPVSRYSHIWG